MRGSDIVALQATGRFNLAATRISVTIFMEPAFPISFNMKLLELDFLQEVCRVMSCRDRCGRERVFEIASPRRALGAPRGHGVEMR